MKHIKLFEEFLNEATTPWKKMMLRAIKSSINGPWSLVAIENNKVVAREDDIPNTYAIPDRFDAMRRDYPRAKLHIEDGTGQVVYEMPIFN